MTRLAVRPPEYIPRPSTLALWLAADRVVLGDTFPVSRQSPQTRAGIRSSEGTGQERLWLSVPLRGVTRGRTPIREAAVGRQAPWQRTHLRAIDTCYRAAPYFEHYYPKVRAILEGPSDTLAEYAVAFCVWMMLEISGNEHLGYASSSPGAPHTLAGVVAAEAASGAVEVLALAESARHEAGRLREAGIDVPVWVVDFDEAPRRQSFEGFVPGLCALDLLMHYGPASAEVLRAGTRVVRLDDWLSMGTS